MVLFDAYTFEVPSPEVPSPEIPSPEIPSWQEVACAPESRSAWGLALGAALIVLAWAPIALLIWALT